MLEIRPGCECCDKDLPPDSLEAMICSFECTFCNQCAQHTLKGICPNCGGELLRRPLRPQQGLYSLETHPASTQRVFKPKGCAAVL
jgi:uncharacterized protein